MFHDDRINGHCLLQRHHASSATGHGYDEAVIIKEFNENDPTLLTERRNHNEETG